MFYVQVLQCGFLTRLYDWINTPSDAMVKPLDPLEFWARLRFHQKVTGPGIMDYGRDQPTAEKIVHLYTDGACLGNPGPGGWGVVLSWDGQMKELSGGQVDTTTIRWS